MNDDGDVENAEDEEEKIRVRWVETFLLVSLLLCLSVLIDFSLSSLFSIQCTHTESLSLSLSVCFTLLLLLSQTTWRRQHCELGAWVKMESERRRNGLDGYVLIFVFCFWIEIRYDIISEVANRRDRHHR